MGRRHQTLAFTIAEALIAAGLFSLMMLLFVKVLGPAFRISSRTSVRSELHQRGSHALRTLCQEMQRCPQSGVVFYEEPSRTLIGLHPLDSTTPDGKPTYSDELILYVFEEGSLKRYLYTDASADFPNSLQRPTATQMRTFIFNAKGPQVVCNSLKSFVITDEDPDVNRLKQPIQLTLELEQGPDDNPERLQLSRKITLRNS